MQSVPPPHFEKPPIAPFSKDDIQSLLKGCESSRQANATNRREFAMRRPTVRRDHGIILTLLGSGLRTSEL